MSDDTVTLVSPVPGLTVILEHDVVDFHPQTGTRIVEPAKKLRFSGGRCVAPASWVPLIRESRAYKGGPRSSRRIWFEDEALDMEGPRGPVAVRGAVSAPVRASVEPPLPDWDTVGARVLVERIEAGAVRDPLGAVAWESTNKRRKTVLTALAGALATGEAPVDDTPDDPGVVEDHFEAEAA